MERGKGFSDEFIRSLLLTLEQTDFDQFMDLSYHVLMHSPSAVIKRRDSSNEKIKSIDNMIKFFEEKEEYEKCTNLQKLKLIIPLDEDDNE
jgi:predicted sugar kinase